MRPTSREPPTPPRPQPGDLRERLERLIAGYRVSQAIAVAAKLGLADHLAAGPRSTEDLAAASGSDASALRRLLRALQEIGLLTQEPGGRWTSTPLGDLLRADAAGSLRASAIMYGEPWSWEPWGHLSWSVQTGEAAFQRVFGVSRFDYLAAHPDAGAIFDAAMAGSTGQDIQPLGAYDLAEIETLVDVGGGNGATLVTLLRANPTLRGVLFDLPHVVADAGARLASAGLAGRCVVVGGDFFGEVPTGGDAYLLRHVLHNWNDQRAAMILANCRRAIAPGGRLFVEDVVIDLGTSESDPLLIDLHMLVAHGGRERTSTEFRDLLGASGFALVRILPIAGALAVVEAVPA